MAVPAPIPVAKLEQQDFIASVGADDLVYFLCNVGDADAQFLLLPAEIVSGARRGMVVDAGITKKVPSLIEALVVTQLMPAVEGVLTEGSIALVVATHPHQDHIGGMPELFWTYGSAIREFWDPGYFHTLPAYHEMMAAVEESPHLLYAQPTSGLRRWIGDVGLTVLSPSIQLRNRFDTYGTEINDASISLGIEFPATRVIQLDSQRNYVGGRRIKSLILGGDAQTLSWSYVDVDFPYLQPSGSAVAKAMKLATGADPMRGQVLKVSHHASKHGINLELIERIAPAFTLVSSVREGGSYGFPHTIAQEIIREALDPTTVSRRPHKPDFELGVFYTSDEDEEGEPLGTIALVLSKGRPTLWRFGDRPQDPIRFDRARRWVG